MVSSSNTTAGKIETIGSKGVESELTFDKFDLSAYADLNAFGFPDGRNYAVIPMTAINIPEDAAGVRVEVGWDLTDIIERREGQTTADDDDIFVLKNNFWDGLSVKIVAE
uniref:Putative lipoprotein n=1 Tax=uncultured bacterium 35A20 TaxID=1194347 RepID=K7PF03_9BACT|nr:putative lipoprotein [uncultured bacterium 35A20]